MTTAIQKAKSTVQLPAEMMQELSLEAANIKARIGTPTGDLISCTKNKTFRLPGIDAEAPELNAIIVDWVSVNQYYEGRYDPNNIRPPVCQAIAVEEALAVPYDESPKKQHDKCSTCKQNQWNSGVGGKGKACKNQRLVALLSPTDPTGALMLMRVMPTATKFFDQYVKAFANGGHAVPHVMAVITLLTFDPKQEYASLRFKALEPAAPDVIHAAFQRRTEARTRLLTKPNFQVPVAA